LEGEYTYGEANICYNTIAGGESAVLSDGTSDGAAWSHARRLSKNSPRERRKMEGKRKGRAKYRPEYPALMYRYFRGFDEQGAPSYLKFAESIGATREDIELWRRHKRFDRSYRECSEIRRDYLIDNALTRRFDPSFVKFLIGYEFGEDTSADGDVSVRLEVVE